MKSKLVSSSLSAVALLALAATHASAVPVKVELSLLIDVSGSVDTNEFNLQKGGYVQAFNNPAIQALIAGTAGQGGIAVNFIQWSGAGQAVQSVGWTQLTDAASSSAFATAINGVTRAFSGQTAPGSAINFATPLFTNGFEGQERVIDVSGDGAENDGTSTSAARTAALAAGITRINGIPILGEAGLLAFYQNNIQGGPNSFTIPADSFDDFAGALTTKLTFEIGGGNPNSAPDGGSTLLLLSSALGCFAFLHRRKSIR